MNGEPIIATDTDKYRHFNELTKSYIPSREKWTPVDDALFTPDDLYRIPADEARQLQMAALKFSFDRHYHNNGFYRDFCRKQGISPADIKTLSDLDRIPLIPNTFFKDYPPGKDFATWLGNLYTGELPRIVIKQKNPTLDQVVDAFNEAGLVITYSSGTSGRHTFIPRDRRTFNNSQYAGAKLGLSMSSGRWIFDSETFLLGPDPGLNSLFVGKTAQIIVKLGGTVHVAIRKKLTLDLIDMTMGQKGGIKGNLIRLASRYKINGIIGEVIDWLAIREKSPELTFLTGTPYLIHSVLKKLKKQGRSFNFGERGGILTGGGWKSNENERVSSAGFRQEVEQILGIPERYCLDGYGMVESNGWMMQCPEGHYFHIPCSYFKPLILDNSLKPVKDGEWGRFAFLDAAAFSYPGFIITGDRARLLDRCPVCDRPGPVLDPEVSRMAGQEDRGCTGEIMRMFSIPQH